MESNFITHEENQESRDQDEINIFFREIETNSLMKQLQKMLTLDINLAMKILVSKESHGRTILQIESL